MLQSWQTLFFALILISSVSVLPASFAQVAPHAVFQSPKKQFEQGLSADRVKCNEDLILMIKLTNGSPACVKPQTAQKLAERGWGTMLESTKTMQYGTLSGNVNVCCSAGPTRVDSPDPSINYEIAIYASDGITVVAKTKSDAKAHYSIQLHAGKYIIYTYFINEKQTNRVSIISGQNTTLDLHYYNGIT